MPSPKNKKKQHAILSFFQGTSDNKTVICSGDQCTIIRAPVAATPQSSNFYIPSKGGSFSKTKQAEHEQKLEQCSNKNTNSTNQEAQTSQLISSDDAINFAKGFSGAACITLTTDYLTDQLKANKVSQEKIYWLSQIPRAAFMYCLNASLGKIVAAPAINYVLKSFMSEGKAAVLTTVATVAVDAYTSPVAVVKGAIAGVLGTQAAKYLYQNGSHFIKNSLFTAKKGLNWLTGASDHSNVATLSIKK